MSGMTSLPASTSSSNISPSAADDLDLYQIPSRTAHPTNATFNITIMPLKDRPVAPITLSNAPTNGLTKRCAVFAIFRYLSSFASSICANASTCLSICSLLAGSSPAIEEIDVLIRPGFDLSMRTVELNCSGFVSMDLAMADGSRPPGKAAGDAALDDEDDPPASPPAAPVIVDAPGTEPLAIIPFICSNCSGVMSCICCWTTFIISGF
mmetsp:Transcript_15760/g.36305  ORF Transcript_15760/g.36305 Transcript_15760/m.36305 type:complete len:209 (-) Transcript_15760:976-1602(-)